MRGGAGCSWFSGMGAAELIYLLGPTFSDDAKFELGSPELYFLTWQLDIYLICEFWILLFSPVVSISGNMFAGYYSWVGEEGWFYFF